MKRSVEMHILLAVDADEDSDKAMDAANLLEEMSYDLVEAGNVNGVAITFEASSTTISAVEEVEQ